MTDIIFTFPTFSLIEPRPGYSPDWYALVEFDGGTYLTESLDRDAAAALDTVIDYIRETDPQRVERWQAEAADELDAIVTRVLQEKMPDMTLPESREDRRRALRDIDERAMTRAYEDLESTWGTGGNGNDFFPEEALGKIRFIYWDGLDGVLEERLGSEALKPPKVFIGRFNNKMDFYYDAREDHITFLNWVDPSCSYDIGETLESIQGPVSWAAETGTERFFQEREEGKVPIWLVKDEDWNRIYYPSDSLREFFGSTKEEWLPDQPAWTILRTQRIAQLKEHPWEVEELFEGFE